MRPMPPAVAQKSRGSPAGGYPPLLAIGQQQVEPVHVLCEAACDVMVLAMDIGRDRAADGYLSRPG